MKVSMESEIKELINEKATIDYIYERQNEDGGYTFCRQTSSSAQDTFYAIEVQTILGIKPRNVEKTVEFLKSLQHQDGSFDSVKVAYYVFKTLEHFGYSLVKPTDWLEQTSEILINGLKNLHVYIDVLSEIENAHLAVELLDNFNLAIDSKFTFEQVSKLQNGDGSFGSSKNSKISSTYHALSILKILNHYDTEVTLKTLNWIRKCEVPEGGFVGEPEYLNTVFMDEIYFGTQTLSVLEENLKYPQETLHSIHKFQNSNGGFRRSIFLGISEFESMYQAMSTIQTILNDSRSENNILI